MVDKPHSNYVASTLEAANYQGEKGSSPKITLPPGMHRWELPVLCYHSIRVIYHYPFLGVIYL